MHLSCVEVKNFRSLEHTVVRLQPGLNALVGRNGTGKTNLLAAIRLALGPSASRGDSIWLEPEDFFKKSPNDKDERTIQINLTFSNLNEDQRAYFFEIMDFDLVKVESSEARIRFEANWPKGKKHPTIKRAGGPVGPDAPEVPSQLMESLPITFLPALRDAEASLTPGHRSRLAMLLKDLASKGEGSPEDDIKAIFSAANTSLEQHAFIQKTRLSLQKTNWHIAGTDYSPAGIRASEMNFDRILGDWENDEHPHQAPLRPILPIHPGHILEADRTQLPAIVEVGLLNGDVVIVPVLIGRGNLVPVDSLPILHGERCVQPRVLTESSDQICVVRKVPND